MELSIAQAKEADKICKWYNDPFSDQIYRLFGYAGTGKSTILKKVVEMLNCSYVVGTFTGKAALVLQNKGTPASTIHSMIYAVSNAPQEEVQAKMREIENARPEDIAKLKEELRALNRPRFALNEESRVHDVDLVVLDEVSMVGRQLAEDLLSFGKRILVLGDPGQLPPVGDAGYFTQAEPDGLLEEIHRQAADSPIITLATTVRTGGRLQPGAYGNCSVRYRAVVPSKFLLEVDQVIVGKNATRTLRNNGIRLALNRAPGLPMVGDKVICLKNDKDLGILNGSLWDVLETSKGRWVDMRLQSRDQPERKPLDVWAHELPFLGKSLEELPYWQRALAAEFDYGYAITCHKAQGSQWDVVYVENESYVFRDDAKKWLYTAITRAVNEVHIGL